MLPSPLYYKCLLLDIGGWPAPPAYGFAPAGGAALFIPRNIQSVNVATLYIWENPFAGILRNLQYYHVLHP